MRAALVVALAVTLGCKGRAAPKVTAEQWAEVQTAGLPQTAPGPADDLLRAVALIEGDRAIEDLPGGFDPDDERLVEALSPAAFEAVDALARWAEIGGRLPPRECVPPPPWLFASLKLARVALLVGAHDPDGRELRAVVWLGARYRAEGVSLLEGMVGNAIVDEARGWADRLELPRTGALRTYAPTEEGLRRLVAAEATCSATLIDKALAPDASTDSAESAALREQYRGLTGAHLPAILAGEADHLRAFWIALLADLRARDADPAAVDARIEARADRVSRDQARHPVVALVVPALSRILPQLRASDDKHRTWLAGAP